MSADESDQKNFLQNDVSASTSPIIKSIANPSTKISVQGDYDQFARQPKKEKNNKSRDRSPISGSNKLKRNSVEKQQSPTQNEEQNTSPEISKSFPKTTEESKDSNPSSSERKDEKGKSKRASLQSEQPSANMSVTTLGGEEGNPTLSRMDSMPPRKHARVEHMKQLRNEGFETQCQNNIPQNILEQKDKAIGTDAQWIAQPLRPNEHAFLPPVASVVDFLDNPDFRDGAVVLNKTFLDDLLRGGKFDNTAMSRLSAKYMIRYLGIGEDPRSKDVISSMLVRPILPPIKQTRKRRDIDLNFHTNLDLDDHSPKFELNPILPGQSKTKDENSPRNWKYSSDMSYHFQRGTRLRQGDSKYVYKPRAHHSTGVLDATTNSSRELLEIGGEIEDNFDRVIRWKSKVRYCGKPAMYKRTTSPTLGEEALKRKLNRLPTRQSHKLWPEQGDLYSKELDQNEAWRRPPSNMNPKLSPLGPPITLSSNGSGFRAKPRRRRSTVINKFQEQNLEIIDTSSRHRGMYLPPPRIPVRKQKPMWQRL